jgi:hypothetical protein
MTPNLFGQGAFGVGGVATIRRPIREMSMSEQTNLTEYLGVMVEKNASDVYFTVASPPMYRIQGIVQPIGEHVFTPEELEEMAKSFMNERQWQQFSEHNEMNLALSLPPPQPLPRQRLSPARLGRHRHPPHRHRHRDPRRPEGCRTS